MEKIREKQYEGKEKIEKEKARKKKVGGSKNFITIYI